MSVILASDLTDAAAGRSEGRCPEGRATRGRPSRVLLTIHRISFGGADRVALQLGHALMTAGIDVRLAILRDGGEGEGLIQTLAPGLALRRAGPALGSRHAELMRGYRFLQAEIAGWCPDVVLATSNNMGLVTGLAALGQRVCQPRLMLKFTNPVVRPRDRGVLRVPYRKLLYRFVLGRYERVLTLSAGERARLKGLYPTLAPRFRTVANPYVGDDLLAPGLGHRRGARIVAAGRLMPQKRFDRLIAAFARLPAPAELVILGDGPLRPALERQIAMLALGDRIRLPGFVDPVAPWLRGADVLALSSDYEGLPAIVLEALACGVPAVATDCFDEANALLRDAPGCAVVARDDVGGFALALERSLACVPDTEALRSRAMPYRVDAALRAHVEAIEDFILETSSRPAASVFGKARS